MNSSKYVIEVENLINNTIKCAYVDRQISSISQSPIATRFYDTMPIAIDELDKDYILSKLMNSNYRMLPDGSKLLPETISCLGGLTLPERKVDFIIRVYKITNINGQLSTTKFDLVTEYHFEGKEGKGNGLRHETNYTFRLIENKTLKAA